MSSPKPTQFYRKIRFGKVCYDFYICSGPASWHTLRQHLTALDTDRFVMVADRGLPTEVITKVESQLAAVAPTLTITAAPTEKTKRLATIDEWAECAILSGVTRQSCVIALGGGVVGNMAGLLAALLYRGIRLIHLPTTLLGMSDSALSIKQAVNSQHGKNHLGTFYPPVLVWNQLEFLDSLPVAEIQAALCETIKNVISICSGRYDEVACKLRPDGRYSAEVIVDFIELCVDAKTKVMRKDPLEKRDGLILEYGHTVGHAVELVSGGKFRHGFAVGVGMLAAARISRLLGYLDCSDEAAHKALLLRNGAPIVLPDLLGVEEVLHTIQWDNKRGLVRPRRSMYDFVLLNKLGEPHLGEGGLITQVDEDVVRAGITSIVLT